MPFLNRIFALGHIVLRIGFVLALLAMLIQPHPRQTVVADMPATVMHHSADVPGQMNHPGGVQHGGSAALCDMICAGLNQAEGPVQPTRFAVFAFARWTIGVVPFWAPVQLEPTPRPPDTPSYA